MKFPLILSLVFAACTGELTPEGPQHKYVVNSVAFPASAGEASSIALVRDGAGNPLNAFGAAIAGAIALQVTTGLAITRGEESVLLDLQARAFNDAIAASVTVGIGGFPEPAACISPNSCGRHLTGTGSFSVVSTSDRLSGSILGGTFLSLIGPLAIEISLDGQRPLKVPLLAAQVQLSRISDKVINEGIIAGAVPRDFLSGAFIDELLLAAPALISRDCNQDCVCLGSTPGGVLVVAFDPDRDCTIDRADVTASSAIQAMLRADLEVDGIPAVSFGMGITAISASFE